MKKHTRKVKEYSDSVRVSSEIKRRDFVKLLGSGIFIFVNSFDFLELPAAQSQRGRSLPKDFNAFLHITEAGLVNCYTGKIEMGQGAITSLPQIMADELEVPYEKVKIIMGDTDLCPYDRGTFGSQTIRIFSISMRAAAAEAREVLLELASAKLNIPVSQLIVKNGVISDSKNDHAKVTYGELTRGKRIEKYLKRKPLMKDHREFKYIGKPYLHQDAYVKVTGEAKFASDILLPGLLHARILRPPSHGAKLTKADVTEVEKIKGVSVVRDGDFIAVLSEDRDKADQAVVRIKAEYSFNEIEVNDKTIFDRILKADSSSNIVSYSGDIETGRESSYKITESEFQNSYVAHAPIEPHAATAIIEGDKVTVWISTQTPFPAQETIAREMGMPLEKVRIITPFVGGGFGGKSPHRQALEAVKLAKATGKPVSVSWTRNEEFFYDTYRPAAVIKIISGVDKSGKIVLWDFHTYYAGSRGSDTIYDVPNSRTTDYGGGSVHPFATGSWRAPGNNTNTFARESQIDIMASNEGTDPLEFRLKNLKDEKMIGVLKAAADLFGYTPAKSPSGRGYGIACGTDVGTSVAHFAEVIVDKKTGQIKVVRVACAQDMGLCVNPQGAMIQMEGCITMGLGYALTEELQFSGGRIMNQSFDTYSIPRFSWVPKIDTVILDKKDQAPQGGGEPAIICMGAVIANAVFDATGARLFQLPMTPERILEALQKII